MREDRHVEVDAPDISHVSWSMVDDPWPSFKREEGKMGRRWQGIVVGFFFGPFPFFCRSKEVLFACS